MNKNSKKFRYIIFLTGLAILFFFIFRENNHNSTKNFNSDQKKIELTDNNLNFELTSKAGTIEEFLSEHKIALKENDLIIPSKNTKLFSGASIIIKRAKNITIKEANKKTQTYSLLDTVEQAIWENKDINLSDDDITNPARQSLISDGMEIAVIHVVIKEETKKQDIDFKTISNEDDKLGWRVKKVTQKGIKGVREIRYKVVYHDNKEISRKVLESNVVKEPTEEIVTQGTYMKLGKANKGQGTWYAWKGGLFAASTTLPRGAYAKVTNTENGKSVVVQINDYGPQGKGRIIDLDKVAFEKLAPLGAGVIGVKVEQVLN